MTQSFNKSEVSAYHVFGIVLTTTGATKEGKGRLEVLKDLLFMLENKI